MRESFTELPKKVENTENRKEVSELKEISFRSFVESRLVESFVTKMKSLGYPEEAIMEFYNYVASLGEGEAESLVATPWSIQNRYLEKTKQQVTSGEKTVTETMSKLLEKNKEFGRAIAYHASKEDIVPKQSQHQSRKGELEWTVYATENDHRDNDLPRAYMSFDYEHLYRQKNPEYLYAVCYRKGEGTGYIASQNENWGRGYGLDVIEKIKIKDLDNFVDESLRQHNEGFAQEGDKTPDIKNAQAV